MSIYTHAEGATQHPEEMLDFLMTALVQGSGVKNSSDTDFQVTESDTPAMTVKVALGKAFLRKSDGSKVYPVYSDANETVNISDNSSGNSRIDAIVLYYNLGGSPATNSTGMVTVVAVEGTPAGSPSAPSDGDIQTEIGASNPFLRLANVLVTTGETTILDADITDTRVTVPLTIVSPTVATNVKDTNSNEIVTLTPVSSAVNNIEIKNNSTGNAPEINAVGDNTNISLYLGGKGTGTVKKKGSLMLRIKGYDTDLEVGDNAFRFIVPRELDGMKITKGRFDVDVAGTTGTTDFQLRNVTDAVDLFSTKATIDSTETSTETGATAQVINTSNDSLTYGEIWAVDIDAVSTTAPKGLSLTIEFEKE